MVITVIGSVWHIIALFNEKQMCGYLQLNVLINNWDLQFYL